MAVTRIKNNQILDSGIWANSKIIPGSVTGALFSSNIVVTSDFVITGNLYVTGATSYVTLASTNTYVNDPLLVLNNAFSGTNGYDLGFVFERGSLVNQAFYWDESSDAFKMIATTETGTTYGSIATESSYSDLLLGNVTAQYDVDAKNATLTNDLTVAGYTNLAGNISSPVVNAGALNSTGFINTTGNISGAVVNTGALNTTGTTTLAATNVSGFLNSSGNISAAVLNGGAINSTGLINTTGNISGAVVNTGALNTTGTTTLAATNISGFLNSSGNISAAIINGGAINSTGLINTTGNVSASQASVATVKASGLTTGRVVTTSADGLMIDNDGLRFASNTLTVGAKITANAAGWIGTTSGDLVLAATDDVDFNGSSAINLADPTSAQDAVTLTYLESALSSDVTQIIADDSFVAVNDSGASGNIVINVDADRVGLITQDTTQVLNNLNVANATVSTSAATGAIVSAGGVGVTGNVVASLQLKSLADWQSLNTTTGAIITAGGVGIAKNLNVGGDVVVTGGLTVQGDYTTLNVATLDVEDLQITVANGAGTSASADGAGINVAYGNVGANITYTHATTSWNLNRTTIIEGTDAATAADEGALQVLGGAGIGGRLYVGSGIQGTVIGNVTAAAASFTTVNASGFVNLAGNLSAAVLNGGAINSTGLINTTGNISGAVVNAGALNATGTTTLAATNISGFLNSSGNISAAIINGGAVNAGTITATGYVNLAGNLSASVMNGGTVNADTLTATGNVIGGLASFASINATPIGNATASSGSFTTLAASGFVNLAGNLSASVVNGGAINSTGLINTTGNISSAVMNTGALNATGTTTLAATNVSGFLNSSANISAAVMNTGTFNASGVATVSNATEASATDTGAIVTPGGVAMAKSVFIGIGATINSTKVATSVTVKGQGNDALMVIDTAKNAAVFSSTGNTLVQDGAVVKFDSTGAIVLPVGSNSNRPGATANVAVAGMLRYSTTASGIEYYDGSEWVQPGTEFTVVASDQFNGDGATVAFTLDVASTTAATIVSINGIVQIPTTAYAVSGTTMTFTEAPAAGDVIDARRFVTTATVNSLANGAGTVQLNAGDNNFANIVTGSAVRISVNAAGSVVIEQDLTVKGQLTVLGDSSGNINIGNESGDKVQLTGTIVYDETPITTQAGNMVIIDSFPDTAYHSAKYFIQMRDGATSSVHSQETMLAQEDAVVTHSSYAVIAPDGEIGTFVSNIASNVVRLIMVPVGAGINANIKVQTTYIV